VHSTSMLRALGPAGLTALLRRRPEVLDPLPPRSLEELSARLDHPRMVSLALHGWTLPRLQVAEAVAALGDRGDRSRLLDLLGLAPDDPRTADLDRTLQALREDGAVTVLRTTAGDRRYRIDVGLAAVFTAPLGLGPELSVLAEHRTVEDLQVVLRALGETPRTRKQELVSQLVAVLGDHDRVRALVAGAPAGLAGQLVEAAFGRAQVQYYAQWHSLRYLKPDGPHRQPVEWALPRFLLVTDGWDGYLTMPAEVAVALRGPGWVAPFDAEPPAVAQVDVPPAHVVRAATAAASSALSTLAALLTDAGTRPIPLLKSGAVGVRELRRLAAAVGADVAVVRLALELASALGLLARTADQDGAAPEVPPGRGGGRSGGRSGRAARSGRPSGRAPEDDAPAGLAPTARFDLWQALPAAERYAHLLTTWLDLPAVPALDAAAAWLPGDLHAHLVARRALLKELGRLAGAAPASPAGLLPAVCWRAPVAVGETPAVAAPLVVALLAEAAWIGATGAEALSPAAAAALAALADPAHGDEASDVVADVVAAVVAAVADTLGSAHATARIQADLTAVVLGEPAPALAALLDRAADRENRSAATVWRFSPASVRRAMDAGTDAGTVAETLLAELAVIADGGVPQPLEYLVRDVARRHGALRGGAVACYLRSADGALLAEVVADRRLAKLGLRRIAPTVVVGTSPLGETLAALRAAGHGPVEEGPDGATIAVRTAPHRAAAGAGTAGAGRGRTGRTGTAATGAVVAVPEGPGTSPFVRAPARPDPARVAAALLAAPDGSRERLLDIGGTVVTMTSVEELSRRGHPLW
jgi:hypothetical protein